MFCFETEAVKFGMKMDSIDERNLCQILGRYISGFLCNRRGDIKSKLWTKCYFILILQIGDGNNKKNKKKFFTTQRPKNVSVITRIILNCGWISILYSSKMFNHAHTDTFHLWHIVVESCEFGNRVFTDWIISPVMKIHHGTSQGLVIFNI